MVFIGVYLFYECLHGTVIVLVKHAGLHTATFGTVGRFFSQSFQSVFITGSRVNRTPLFTGKYESDTSTKTARRPGDNTNLTLFNLLTLMT